MRFDEQVSGQRSEAAKTVRYEHAILQSASFKYCAQFRLYVKARSSPELHNSTVDVLPEVSEGSFLVGFEDFGQWMNKIFACEKEKLGRSIIPAFGPHNVHPHL